MLCDNFAVLAADWPSRSRAAPLAGRVDAFHLAGRVQDELDAIGALVIDAPAAHGLCKVVYHGPGHPGQVAQVAVLTLRL